MELAPDFGEAGGLDAPIEPMTNYREMAFEFAWDLFHVDSVDRTDGWRLPLTSSGRGAAEFLMAEGKVEKHERWTWYRAKEA
jgi:hypothetical protein